MSSVSTIATVAGASFAASFVEAVEALTVVLAVGLARGWRPALTGAAAALAALSLMVAVLGPLIGRIPLHALQAVVGVLLLLFGLRWLRKAILRAIGVVALHDEAEAFARETHELVEAERQRANGLDWIAGVTAFKAVMLEGTEVVFIVIAVGAGGLMWLASAGALAACVLVAAIGAAAVGPLSQVPENALKFAVGVMLSAFGLFWTGESLGVDMAGRRRGDPGLRRHVSRRSARARRAAQAEGARMIGAIVRQLVGLFVDDGLLAVGILVAVGAIAFLTLLGALPTWLAGLLLAVSLQAALAASVVGSVRRARRPKRSV